MKKIFFSINIFLFPLFAFSQLLSAPVQMDKGLQKIIGEVSKNRTMILPYGDKNLLQQYDDNWKFYNTKNTNENSIKNPRFDSLVGQLDIFFQSDFENKARAKTTVSYVGNSVLFLPHFAIPTSTSKKKKSIEIRCSKFISEKDFTTYSVVFSGIDDCTNCEYTVKRTQNILISVNRDNKIVDKLLIGNVEGNDLGLYRLYFYIDPNKIIHLKDFSSDELEDGFLNYEQYQILPNGSFARYYADDGVVKNNTEQGTANEHKRDGKWIEKKQNYNIDLSNNKNFKDNYTWLEAIYKNGVPVGQWNYYKLLQKYDDKGHAILSSRKKGKLLYIENYSNGVLKKKLFVK
jgi:hypothetical protein